jgi:hypothetical protein
VFVLGEWDEERGGLEKRKWEIEELRRKRNIRKWLRMSWAMAIWCWGYKELNKLHNDIS